MLPIVRFQATQDDKLDNNRVPSSAHALDSSHTQPPHNPFPFPHTRVADIKYPVHVGIQRMCKAPHSLIPPIPANTSLIPAAMMSEDAANVNPFGSGHDFHLQLSGSDANGPQSSGPQLSYAQEQLWA